MECAEAVYLKRRAHKLWRRHKTDHHRNLFKEARANCKNTIGRAKRSQLADETNSEVISYHAKRSKLAYKTNMDETDSKVILDAKRPQLADETNTDETNSKIILDNAKRSQLVEETNTDNANSKVILDNAKPSQLAGETNTDKTNSKEIQRLGGKTTCYRWESPTTIFMGKTKYVKYVAKSRCTSFCDNCPCGVSRRRTKISLKD